MNKFQELGLNSSILKAIEDMGFESPSEVQEKTIPILLDEETDMVALAQTGTGKTAAFGFPLIQKIDPKSKHTQALILSPTRELCLQITNELKNYSKYEPSLHPVAVYGGASITDQAKQIERGAQIIVATPGRMQDMIRRKLTDISKIEYCVLDEADEMLSMGFKKELDEILCFLPAIENKWLFSATIPHGIQEIISKHLAEDAERIEVSRYNVINKNISHQYVKCTDDEKLHTLQLFLKSERENRGVIFCKTKAATQKLAKQLIAKNIATDAIHGDLLQKERDKVMRAFKNETLRVLVATDVAARGIDISGLTFVAHYQLPESDEYYTHRSGRTARAGKEGISMCFANNYEVKILRNYERTLGIKFRQVKEVR